MSVFSAVGDFFRGAFGESDEERKRRKQREAQEAAQRRAAQAQQPKPQPQQSNQPKIQNVSDLFGAKRPTDPLGVTQELQQNKPPQQPRPQAPRVVVQPPPDAAQIRQKAMDYQNPKVQDVNNYYGNDLKVLQDELAKGDKTDYHRVQGIMQSLDNRRKELQDFHKQRGENPSFKTARQLQDTIKETRGNWDAENQKLKQFWDGVSKNEKDDFIAYLNEKGVRKPQDQHDAALALMRGGGTWKNGTGMNYSVDFTKDNEKVQQVLGRQKIADAAMRPEIYNQPLDQLGGKSIADWRYEFSQQNPNEQRDTIHSLEKIMTENENNFSANPDLKRKYEQAFVLHNVLMDSNLKKENFGTRVADFGAGAKDFGKALFESPGHVVQSVDALVNQDLLGKGDRGEMYDKLHREGKLSDEEYNKAMNAYQESLKWVPDESKGMKGRLLTAAGTSADTVATFLPVLSVAKGAKGAYVLDKLAAQMAVEQGISKEAATIAAKETLAAMAKDTAASSLKRTMAEEALANAGFSGVGSLRTGEFDPKQFAKETATGGIIGGVSPAIGSKATQLWQKLRGVNTAAPEALEDVGRVTTRLGGGTGDSIVNDIIREPDPKVLQDVLNIDPLNARKLALETDPEVVKETLRQLSVDPSLHLSDDVVKRLQDEGITAVKQDPNAQYPAEYKDGTITARSQADLDANVYHELGHDIYQNKLTPEEKALFKGEGEASQSAKGRQGYTQDDVNSEDFSDYMNKALTGRISEVPAEFRSVIAKYAKVALNDSNTAQNVLRSVATEQKNQLDNYFREHPNLNDEQKQAALQFSKQRSIELVNQFEQSRAASAAAIEAEANKTAGVVQGVQGEAEAAAAARAAQENPTPVPGVEATPAPAGNPEVPANNAYAGQKTEDILYGDAPQFDERGNLSIGQRLSPDRFIRENITRPLEGKINEGIAALQRSDNRALQPLGRFFTGFSREAGVTPELQTARMQLRGGVETGKLNRETIADLSKGFGNDELNRVWATLDPEFAQRAGMEVPAQLSPAEADLQAKLKTVIDNTTQENLRRGLITPEQAASDSYIKRSYSIYDGNEEAGKFERGFRQELLGQYKGRKVVSDAMVEDAIKDPTYLVGKKTAESEAMWAMQDYGNYLNKSGIVSDIPKRGYTQLPDSPVFGEAAGKYVPQNLAEDFTGFQYNNAMISAWNDLITAYDRLGIRQAKKQLLTIFNPAVRLGNQTTNRAIFSQLNGINPLEFNYYYARMGKQIGANSQLYREAVSQGLTGVDITQAEFFARRVAQAGDNPNLGKQALDWVKSSYSDADDKARIAAYAVHRNRGYSPEEAARLVQRGFQDYKSVGFFYDMAAKTPIIGNAFVRFAGDSVRIAKNAAIDHPLRSLATVAAWSTFVNGMSVVSGESQLQGDTPTEQLWNLTTGKSKSDAQKEREGRFGAPKIPFTDISTTVQTPWGEVNVARFMPWYQLNDISDTQVARFLPFQASPIERSPEGGFQVNSKAMNDPLLGQVVQLMADRDFRGKSIQDPAVSPENKDQFRDAPLSDEQKRNNVLRFLFTGNAPLGREIDQTRSAIKGEPDIYGKTRSVPQAIARDFGFKVEQQGAQQAKDRQSMADYQAEKAQIDKEVEGMSPGAQEAYKRLTGYYKLRDQVPNEFKPGDTRNKKSPQYDFGEDKWRDLAAHPELYKLLVDKKQREFAKDGKPVPPEYDPRLSEEFRRQLIANKSVAPGDDAELDQRMYSQPEWDFYQTLKDRYKETAKKYYKDDGNQDFTDELVKHQDAKFPEKPALLKAYSAAYKDYLDGKRNKPGFTDEMKALKEQYNHQTLNWTNEERKARGLPAITWDTWNNPTFGFDETPSGFGFGFGGGGSNYNPADHVNAFGKLTSFGSDVPTLNPIEAQAMPNIVQIFQKLYGAGGGGRAKPKLGAGSSGR